MTPDKIQEHVRDMLIELAKVVADPASIQVEKYEVDDVYERLTAKLPTGDRVELHRRLKGATP